MGQPNRRILVEDRMSLRFIYRVKSRWPRGEAETEGEMAKALLTIWDRLESEVGE